MERMGIKRREIRALASTLVRENARVEFEFSVGPKSPHGTHVIPYVYVNPNAVEPIIKEAIRRPSVLKKLPKGVREEKKRLRDLIVAVEPVLTTWTTPDSRTMFSGKHCEEGAESIRYLMAEIQKALGRIEKKRGGKRFKIRFD